MPLPRPVVAAVALAALAGCRPPAPPPAELAPAAPWFEDVTDRLGIDFTHDAGPPGEYRMYQAVGSGCAAHDLDGDGRPDLLFLTNGGPAAAATNRLYRQSPDGRFADATAGSGLGFPGFNMGVSVADADRDGRPDVVVTGFAAGARLFLNRGELRFEEATAAAGLGGHYWGASAVFLDYDRDGWLDLVVAGYVDYDPGWPCRAPGGEPDYCAPKVFAGTPTRLYRNRGAGAGGWAGFEDVTARAGIAAPGPGLGVAAADFDGDGWPDVFVANDGAPNRLWVNRRDGTFRDEATGRGVAYTMSGQAFAGMGVGVGDVDNDGLLDLYVTHLTSETNTLWKQGPRGVFADATAPAGLAALPRGTGFGTVVADFDLDGWPDIAVANGRVSRGPAPADHPGVAPHWAPYAERNFLFANDRGRFRDVSASTPALCGTPNVARGLAAADLDGDGAPDLVITTAGGRARVLRNVAPGRAHWLAVRAVEPAPARDALGAVVTVRVGGAARTAVVGTGDSYLSAGPPVARFGLGAAGAVEAVEVRWPGGEVERFPGGPADRVVTVRRGEGVK